MNKHYIVDHGDPTPDNGQTLVVILDPYLHQGRKVFVTSDLHFDHRFIAGLRGYVPADEEEKDDSRYESFEGAYRMTSDLIRAYNSIVDENDIVINLGDVTSGSYKSLVHVEDLNGIRVLIAGNHDAVWTRQKPFSNKVNRRYSDVFDYIVTKGSILLGGEDDILLSHLPVVGDSHDYESRYDNMRMPVVDNGIPVICGHVHGAWETNGRNLNVGVDWHDGPITLEDAVSRAKSLTGFGSENTDKTISEIEEAAQ